MVAFFRVMQQQTIGGVGNSITCLSADNFWLQQWKNYSNWTVLWKLCSKEKGPVFLTRSLYLFISLFDVDRHGCSVDIWFLHMHLPLAFLWHLKHQWFALWSWHLANRNNCFMYFGNSCLGNERRTNLVWHCVVLKCYWSNLSDLPTLFLIRWFCWHAIV